MSTKAAHATLPWRRGQQLGTIISDDARDFDEHYGGHLVCETCLKANTELIITAVNHHQELLTRLQLMIDTFDDNFPEGGPAWVAIDEAKKTLKKVKQ